MTAPNIEMIASLMRSCSLGGRGRRTSQPPPSPPPPPPPQPLHSILDLTDENEGVTVELNSEVALPYPWEQRLDMTTGEVYYINWKDGNMTTKDPRTSTPSSYYYYSSEDDDSSDDDTSEGDGDGDDSGDATGYSSCVSYVSSPSPRGVGQTLVAAGCKACFMYFMVPKRVEDCPKCGGGLLHLGRNGCL